MKATFQRRPIGCSSYAPQQVNVLSVRGYSESDLVDVVFVFDAGGNQSSHAGFLRDGRIIELFDGYADSHARHTLIFHDE